MNYKTLDKIFMFLNFQIVIYQKKWAMSSDYPYM